MNYTFTKAQVDSSLFPPIIFSARGEMFCWFAPFTEGVGNTILVARKEGNEWVSFYGKGRELTISEVKSRGGVVAYVALHAAEVTAALSEFFKVDGNELKELIAEVAAELARYSYSGQRLTKQ